MTILGYGGCYERQITSYIKPVTEDVQNRTQSEHPTKKIEAWFQDERRFGQLSRELAADVHAVLVWDQAGYHKSKELKIPDNITIIPLPPYSHELNPMENLWYFFRSHYRDNRVYSDYNDLCGAAIEARQKAALDPEIIKKVCRA